MLNREQVITTITSAASRKSLYHFTRVSNLPALAHFDTLLSSYSLHPHLAGERRIEPKEVIYDHYPATINAHLRIPDSMMDAAWTLEQFRAALDMHVFFWPTLKDCQKMLDTYTRREPGEMFAVLELGAYSLMLDHYPAVKLSKYDSGSSPRFPKHCTYKKSPDMFLPLDEFKIRRNHTVPVNPSEIREVLFEEQVKHITKYLRSIYIDDSKMIPERWQLLAKPLSELLIVSNKR
ncbi:hypothetical protein J23TS9_19210 [Paenibacillus sp. J23TS9]|uniref:DUF7002 family protein n=1 Tax=Paenibacillus sp. J23TS9 TaxID=2807193 RepID=UPI001B1E55B2|nr:hypothetical protein [Paenibacillus sp. J23TS9]GIP26791.1 hypothetical protein J23TS9_19210 [Paenibacillus sp. J23TS9]